MELFGYQMFDPPVSMDFRNLSRKEAQIYFKWFMENIPVRLNELERALACNGGRQVKLDFTVESLCPLEDWFQNWVEIYNYTPEELQRKREGVPTHLQELFADWTLAVQTLSLCFDIGIYVGEIFRRLHPEVHWELVLGGKRTPDCNEPVLKPFPYKGSFNPAAIVMVVAFKIVGRTSKTYDLYNTFLIWENLLKGIVPTLPSQNEL